MEDKKQVKAKIVTIINSKPALEAVQELLIWQQNVQKDQVKVWIQEPILFILESQHDWLNIQKCLKNWKSHQKFERSFHQRMKKRLEENYDMNISQRDIKKQLSELIEKYNEKYPGNKALISNIQRYFQVKKQQKPIQPKSTVQFFQRKEKKQLDPKQQAPKNKQIAENSASNSLSSRRSLPQIKPAVLRKPTLGMLAPKQNKGILSDKIQSRNIKRLTFGMRDTMHQPNKNISQIPVRDQLAKDQSVRNQPVIDKKQEVVVESKLMQNKQNQMNQGNQITKKIQEPLKANIFQRKQEPIRVNTIYRTTKKEQNEIQGLQKDNTSSRSFGRSITPHKPLVQRKKIVIKKNHEVSNEYDDFQSISKYHDSFEKQDQIRQHSQKKKSREVQIFNCQEEELKNQIEKQEDKSSIKREINQQQIMKSRKPNRMQTNQRINKTQRFDPKEKAIFIKQHSKISMSRRPDQLFSDFELSLVNLNIGQVKQSQPDIYKIVNKFENNHKMLDNFNDYLKKKIEHMKNKQR